MLYGPPRDGSTESGREPVTPWVSSIWPIRRSYPHDFAAPKREKREYLEADEVNAIIKKAAADDNGEPAPSLRGS